MWLSKLNLICAPANVASTDIKSRASGLAVIFGKGNTFLALRMALLVFAILENLCRSLQSQTQTVSGMLLAVSHTLDRLKVLRSDDEYAALFSKVEDDAEKLGLEEAAKPRTRRVPRRLEATATAGEAHVFEDTKTYYRSVYYTMLDVAHSALQSRFDQESFKIVNCLEETLLNGTIQGLELGLYPEIDISRLRVQLPMFRSSYQYESVEDARCILQKASIEVKELFSEVCTLIRLLAVLPASSCESERSFSAMRRLKTYLRSTMSQQRLNNVAVCHVHCKRLRSINVRKVMQDFVCLNDSRMHLFGKV